MRPECCRRRTWSAPVDVLVAAQNQTQSATGQGGDWAVWKSGGEIIICGDYGSILPLMMLLTVTLPFDSSTEMF